MPTDPSINLSTSAAAAFCARLCVHPLDHFKASLHQSNQPLQQQELRPRLAHFLTTIRHHLHTLHLHSSPQQQQHKSHHHTTFREQLKLYRRLYHGAPLALIINVPALAFFLSTYDATKHFIAYLSSSSHLNLTHFQLHHFETHLISGLMAKVAGTILWAPQAKLSRMQGSHHGQLSLQEALQLLKKVAASGGSGVWSLWSGYRTTLNSLLPYTMLYFATYEKLKQFARLRIISREEQQLQDKTSSQTAITGAGREIDYRTDQRPLDLGTYMVCVAGAVAISATVCHTADALRVHIQDRWTTASSSTSVSTVLSAPRSATTSPMLPSSPVFRNSGSIMTPNSLVTSTLVATTIPQQYHHHSHAHAHTPVTQHANMTTTTTTTPAHSPRRPLTTSGTGYQLHRRKQTSSGSGGLLRRIGRGLGPRVMWTAPGVTLTTAGFEVFRNLALGIM